MGRMLRRMEERYEPGLRRRDYASAREDEVKIENKNGKRERERERERE